MYHNNHYIVFRIHCLMVALFISFTPLKKTFFNLIKFKSKFISRKNHDRYNACHDKVSEQSYAYNMYIRSTSNLVLRCLPSKIQQIRLPN